MDYGSMRSLVARCWYDTVTANAFRKAFGLPTEMAQKPERDRKQERRERYWARMMKQRTGALDRR